MNIPKFWAEVRLQRPRARGQKQIVVRRWGWSQTSQAEADTMAQARASDALARIARGEHLSRREKKVPYNGADGLPIREEIVHESGDMVVTRNVYGARCLNVPGVLFADVDEDEDRGLDWFSRIAVTLFLLFLVVAAVNGALAERIGGALTVLVVSVILGRLVKRMVFSAKGGHLAVVRKRLERWLERNRGWRVRLYRTPAGVRLLAVHRTFDPAELEVASFFRAMKVDPLFARMCLNQHCFRARISGKPWRMGIADSLRPRPGVWPISPERLPERIEWVKRYEAKAASFAACLFMEEFGDGATDGRALAVQRYHDAQCRALSSLPLA